MEHNPLGRPSFEDGKNSKKDEKNKRRKRSKFAAPIPLEGTEKDSQPEASALDKAVAELALRKRAEREAAAREKAAGEAETPRESEASAESSADTKKPAGKPAASEADGQTVSGDKEEATPERADEVERYKLLPTDLNGGEVIIHLQGDASREERVLPPADENAGDESPMSPLTEGKPVAAEAGSEPLEPIATEAADSVAAAGGGETPPPEPPPHTLGVPEPPEPPRRTAFTAAAVPIPGTELPREQFIDRPDLLAAPFDASAAMAPAETSLGSGGAAKYESGVPKDAATREELDDAIYRATKSGQDRGVVAGLLVGGGFEHWRHRRREKKQAEALQHQGEEVQDIRAQQDWQRREHGRQLEALRRAAPAVASERPAGPNRTVEQAFSRKELRNEAGQTVDTHRQTATDEAKRSVSAGVPEERPLEMPPEHRLQTSAWHSIEVDTRTGKPVERPSFEYGHEYYRERAQEAGPKEQVNTAAGEAALVAAALASSTDAPGGRDSANQPMLPPSAETHVTPQAVARQRARQAGSRLQTGGPIWPWAVALVVVVSLLIVVLR
jgi:hypothetical protein